MVLWMLLKDTKKVASKIERIYLMWSTIKVQKVFDIMGDKHNPLKNCSIQGVSIIFER